MGIRAQSSNYQYFTILFLHHLLVLIQCCFSHCKVRKYFNTPEIFFEIFINNFLYLCKRFLVKEELEMHLSRLGLTKEDYIEFIAKKFNEIHSGNTPLSLLLAVANEDYPNHVAAVRLNYKKNENFWIVTTVHAIRPDDLKRIPLIWKK